MHTPTKSALAALLLLALCSCAAEPGSTAVTEPVTPEQIHAMIDSAEASLRAAQTTALPLPETTEPDTTALPTDAAVYWSPSGGVWHTTPDCPSLKQAKAVLSGTVVDARAAGKARACRTCGE